MFMITSLTWALGETCFHDGRRSTPNHEDEQCFYSDGSLTVRPFRLPGLIDHSTWTLVAIAITITTGIVMGVSDGKRFWSLTFQTRSLFKRI